MAHHGYPQDVKVNMTDDTPTLSRDEATVPLLAGEKGLPLSEPQGSRRRCPFSQRTAEQRAQCKARVKSFIRRLLAAALLVWIGLSFFGRQNKVDDEWFDDYEDNSVQDAPAPWSRPLSPLRQLAQVFNPLGDMTSDSCTSDLVPWDGPSYVETLAQDIRVNFGKGHVLSTVAVRTGDVAQPILFIHADVTKTRKEEEGPGDGEGIEDNE
ncbi:hypothetical protein BGX31_000215, partial [Mortierella sp. GBA43]